MKRSTATVAAGTSRCFAPKIIRTSTPPRSSGPLHRPGRATGRHSTHNSGRVSRENAPQRMRRATTDSGAAGRTSDRRAGRAVEERRSRAGVDEDLVVAPSGGVAVEKERHRGGRAGRASGMSVGSPRWRRMRSITAGSSITAMSCRRPPHRGHSRTSNPRLRRMNSAQRPFAAGGGSPTSAASLESSEGEFSWEPTGSPNRTTSARHAARGASTP